jgi:cytochrome c-type biogenesis protein CcmF
MVPLLITLGFGMRSRWKKDEWERLWKHVRLAFVASLVLGSLVGLMLSHEAGGRVGLAVLLGTWILVNTGTALFSRVHRQRAAGERLRSLPGSFLGMCLAHAGLAITLIGIAVSSNYSSEVHKRMGVGDRVDLSGFTFVLADIHTLQGPNYRATEATVRILKDGTPVTTLHTQKRLYNVRSMTMTEAGIHAGFTRDFYVSLGEPLDHDDWSMRFYYKPFVRWIWLGALMMVLGGLFAVSDRRYRTGAEATGPALQGLVPEIPPHT